MGIGGSSLKSKECVSVVHLGRFVGLGAQGGGSSEEQPDQHGTVGVLKAERTVQTIFE